MQIGGMNSIDVFQQFKTELGGMKKEEDGNDIPRPHIRGGSERSAATGANAIGVKRMKME